VLFEIFSNILLCKINELEIEFAVTIYGIIGRPLGHSFSKPYFERKFIETGLAGHRYYNFPLNSISELPDVLAEYPGLAGFNVTIPYKKEIIPLLDEISDDARAIGAVNCVKVSGGKLYGHNTDAYGFRVGLEKLLGIQVLNNSRPLPQLPDALVLGSGGASAAVCHVLSEFKIQFLNISRIKKIDNLIYSELSPSVMDSHRLIINTTPLGTWPDAEAKPDIPYECVGEGHFLYDLVYNPPLTAFLAEGKLRGATVLNGETMLRAQAEKSWEIWNG
jgi:shikimate dehydrogenase